MSTKSGQLQPDLGRDSQRPGQLWRLFGAGPVCADAGRRPHDLRQVAFDPPPYLQPGSRRVDTPVNKTIRYWALGLTLANLDSSWDSSLDISNYMNVTLKGAIDDVTYDLGVPVKEFVHPQTGQVYRAAQFDVQRAGIGVSIIDELNTISGVKGTPGTLPLKYGAYNDGTAVPDWQTAKANLDAATLSGDQTQYNQALNNFQNVDYLLSYRVDLLGDLRRFRSAFGYERAAPRQRW